MHLQSSSSAASLFAFNDGVIGVGYNVREIYFAQRSQAIKKRMNENYE